MRALLENAARSSQAIVLALLVLAVSGCGFSLRGAAALSGNLPELQLNLQQPNSETARLLRRALEDANVILSDMSEGSIDSATPVLSVGAE